MLKEFVSRLKDAVCSIEQGMPSCRRRARQLENVESEVAVADIAQKIVEKVRLSVFVFDRVLSIATSIGIAVCGWENADSVLC